MNGLKRYTEVELRSFADRCFAIVDYGDPLQKQNAATMIHLVQEELYFRKQRHVGIDGSSDPCASNTVSEMYSLL